MTIKRGGRWLVLLLTLWVSAAMASTADHTRFEEL